MAELEIDGSFKEQWETTKPAFTPLLLTRREADVVAQLFNIGNRRDAAKSLGMALNTFDHHLKSVFRKAHVEGSIGLVAKVWRNGGFLW